MINNKGGINMCNFTGYVKKHMKVGENREGVPYIKFIINVPVVKGYMKVRCAVFGESAVYLTKVMKEGDLGWIVGMMTPVTVRNNHGVSYETFQIVAKQFIILETKENREKRQELM